MIIDTKIKLINYKCFDDSGQGFEKIMPINVIIGKNNSGKSSLIELVEYLSIEEKSFLSNSRENNNTCLEFEIELNENTIETFFNKNSSNQKLGNLYEYGKQFINSRITFQISEIGITLKSIDKDYDDSIKEIFAIIAKSLITPFNNKKLVQISAERDILPENSRNEIEVSKNGDGLTFSLHKINLSSAYDSEIIETNLLNSLNKIIEPDIKFNKIRVQENDKKMLEIYLSDQRNNSIPLSKMGSGIKTVLLVLYCLVVKPELENIDESEYVFAFEELENNLHPSMLKRLLQFIIEYSKIHSTYFFITSHSNIVIDVFGNNENSQIIHLINDGISSQAKTVLSSTDKKDILNDLGVKASDILQSNGIIWVEGPSDRNYINAWLKANNSLYKEGIHYSIMTYGGRLLASFEAKSEWINEKLIPILNINTNAFVVMDRDGSEVDSQLNITKKRIVNEIGEQNCWVTQGREIENYLSASIIVKWLKSKNIRTPKYELRESEKIENTIQELNKNCTIHYNRSKTNFSHEIVEFIEPDDLVILNLKEKMDDLLKAITNWNT
ncbi:MAG: AAA family ATPase [Candidatus Kapaibacterium sp.]